MYARKLPSVICILLVALSICGCQTIVETQHYVGVYDVEQQVTQELYRVTIRGESGPMSEVQYASGWVPAAQADLLASKIELAKNMDVSISGDPSAGSLLPPSHRYFEMGPLGVTPNPEKGRFVIVMNSDPDKFFNMIASLTRYGNNAGVGDAAKQALLVEIGAKRREVLKLKGQEQAQLK